MSTDTTLAAPLAAASGATSRPIRPRLSPGRHHPAPARPGDRRRARRLRRAAALGAARKAVEDHDGAFVGLANFAAYFGDPALAGNLFNSLWVSALSTVICVTLAFVFAYGLTRTCMPGRGVFKAVAQIPILAPSLLPAISLVYLFGNQGLLKSWLMGASIYGPIGIVIGEVFWTFPHALIILTTALAISDARLYEAAEALRARSGASSSR